MNTPKLPTAAALLLLVSSSCSKLGQLIPVPPPVGVIQNLEQTPFKTYTDSLFALTSTGTILTISGVALNDNSLPGNSGEYIGQAEIGYAFRSSVDGAVTSLGVLLPTGGFKHTVTLWDSATGQVLAQADVPTLNGGKWTYVSLAVAGQAVPIEAGHGYIVGFNSLAAGNSIGTYSTGNSIYILDGIYTLGGGGPKIPIVPFTKGPVTFENYYFVAYDTPISNPIFPPAGSSANFSAFDVPGVCDIGFIPAP
ncbi:MAG TPA: DUF4082 domain-containing protein [Puia sp.]|uniref:DUF4082 domain-containing protein n=1 Tax=Puia sp. TaxID=2045100 RepID=UPI002B59414B|nr:DUF4082 domain-containing protein [Puia sp.]HVU97648.1 DUF4082 domain-containing protein [Puia sp.]